MDEVGVAAGATFLFVLGIGLFLFGILGIVALWVVYGWYWAIGALFLAVLTRKVKWLWAGVSGVKLYFEILAIVVLVGTGWAWAYGILTFLGILMVALSPSN